MTDIGLEVPRSGIAHSMEEALAVQQKIGFPTIVRPSFTLGGSGSGIAYNREEFEQIARSGIDASPVGQILIDESLLGWKEYEMEVVRDHKDNCIIICSIENFDPMGIHTGDSITVAPAQTLTDKEYQIMRDASLKVLRKIGVETGGSNVQFSVNPQDGRMTIIEMNPRVSRSSALASKATGFPIAKVAAKLAIGYTLDELRNDLCSELIVRTRDDLAGVEVARLADHIVWIEDGRVRDAGYPVGEGPGGRAGQRRRRRALARSLRDLRKWVVADSLDDCLALGREHEVQYLLVGDHVIGLGDPMVLVYAALSLTVVRMLPVALAFIGTGFDRVSILFMGWFGPRGLASVVFVLLGLEALGRAGVSSEPLGSEGSVAKDVEALSEGASEMDAGAL